MLTLGGNYVNSPKEDFETFGAVNPPLTLDQLSGVIAEIGFGEAKKRGEWQVVYRRRLMSADVSAQAFNEFSRSLSLASPYSQVLKASYNIRDRWQLGIAAVVIDRSDTDLAGKAGAGQRGGDAFGFQIDTSFRF